MVTAANLARFGYFPQEAPVPFGSVTFGDLVENRRALFPAEFDASTKKYISEPCLHNLGRPGLLRRKLSLPNPASFLRVSECVETHWPLLLTQFGKGTLSLSVPTGAAKGGRALGRKYTLAQRPIARARLRAKSRYLLVADISLFYPSIYTHTIPWAIHGKAHAKANKHDPALPGNALDIASRSAQDGQSIGIPIGPDTSLVLAESLLAGVDEYLQTHMPRPVDGFRYIDDYELGFESASNADEALAVLQSALQEFQLQLNPSKTRIIETPQPVEAPWIADLRGFPFGQTRTSQISELTAYFDKAFVYARTFPTDPVLNFAVARLGSVLVKPRSWELCEALILQACVAQPGTLRFALDLLKFYQDLGYRMSVPLITETLERIVVTHVPLGHGSEVAWAIWTALLLGLPLGDRASSTVAESDDNFVAVLALHANADGLMSTTFVPAKWGSLMTTDELRGENWLLAYEASVHGWLSSVGAIDHIAAAPEFEWLRDNQISFYDDRLRRTYVTKVSSIQAGGAGGPYA